MSTATSVTPLAILVVDDDPALVGAISALLTAGDYTVHAAYNGVEAGFKIQGEKDPGILKALEVLPEAEALLKKKQLLGRGTTTVAAAL